MSDMTGARMPLRPSTQRKRSAARPLQAGLPVSRAPSPQARAGYYIGFNARVEKRSTDQLLALCGEALRTGHPEVTLCMASTGGMLDVAHYVYNVLEALPLRIVTYNLLTVQSAAILIFMCGDERYGVPGSTFFFHNPTLETQAQRLTGSVLSEKLKTIEDEITRSTAVYAAKTGRSVEQIRKWQAADTTMDTGAATRNRIVTGVKPLVIPKGAIFQQVTAA
jgi:ATP-dependent protease ClpP protease subunit